MKNQFKPYKDEAAGGYLYGVLHPEIVVLPLGIIWDLIEAWDNVNNSTSNLINAINEFAFPNRSI